MIDQYPDLLEALQAPDAKVVFLTGAGISLASGIPTFRGSDPDAIWAKDVMEMGTFSYFRQHPANQWEWYLNRFTACRTAKPNNAHYAVATLEKKLQAAGKTFTIITQNVDGLHLGAGSENVIEIHGSARKMRCANTSCANGGQDGFLPWDDNVFEAFLAEPTYEKLPRCPLCGDLMRAHVLWFDESYADHTDYHLEDAYNALENATCMICVGTSFSVGITDIALFFGLHGSGIPFFVLDPNLTKPPVEGTALIPEASEVFLPKLAEIL